MLSRAPVLAGVTGYQCDVVVASSLLFQAVPRTCVWLICQGFGTRERRPWSRVWRWRVECGRGTDDFRLFETKFLRRGAFVPDDNAQDTGHRARTTRKFTPQQQLRGNHHQAFLQDCFQFVTLEPPRCSPSSNRLAPNLIKSRFTRRSLKLTGVMIFVLPGRGRPDREFACAIGG